MKVTCHKHRWFSTLPSTPSSSLPWISPLQFLKTASLEPDLPRETTTTLVESRRKPKYISHESAVSFIKRERDPQRALEIFNKVSDQKGFNHNNATYATILDKLARSKKFQAVDAILHQMTYEACRFHEGIFLNLMKHFSKSSLHERVLEMFSAIQTIAREKPSLKAISTCLNLLVESNQVDLARTLLVSSKKNLNLEPNTCIFNILVKYHSKNGDLESAFQVVKEMKSFSKAGRTNEALELLQEMKEKDCKADTVTFNVIIGGLCREGRFEEAFRMLYKLPNEGVYLYKASYRIVLNFLCKEEELEKAVELLGLMLSRGFVPHFATSNELLVRLCESGMVADAAMVLFGLVEMGFKPEPRSWSLLVELICRERKLLPAFELLDELVITEL
ncbi:pentatricopeptide repeat (PPR) superfamily protein [Actinidia rufa]|uniref:Pentatricopeptide repeat (PPR) superfamily protein n=1 Tax=Actinidia rufa TaxID=165716 RepID=A0A7J0EIZ2_9ERIC|nr:pentatricopeptide repeat (PPR) superfamily protein [Actinidia rufa]